MADSSQDRGNKSARNKQQAPSKRGANAGKKRSPSPRTKQTTAKTDSAASNKRSPRARQSQAAQSNRSKSGSKTLETKKMPVWLDASIDVDEPRRNKRQSGDKRKQRTSATASKSQSRGSSERGRRSGNKPQPWRSKFEKLLSAPTEFRNSPMLSPQLIAMRTEVRGRGKNRFENRYDRMANRNLAPELEKMLPDPPQNTVKLIPLGGLCEIGKNMYAYEYGDDIIVVDAGVMFAGEEQPGIDAVVPGMDYLFENRNKLRGLFITHGHEDHIGSVQWLLKDARCPVYAGPLTISLIKGKLEEFGLKSRFNDLHIVRNGEVQAAGQFEVEFIHVNHSIADSSALAIRCPAGTIIHSGDFKIDYTPIHGKPIDLPRFSELGDEGVLLFVCESTNIGKPGFSMSESVVRKEFSKQFDAAKSRVIVATFSSNVHRVQQVISAAEEHGRKVLLLGRSMLNVFKCANDLGYLDYKKDTFIEEKDLIHYPDDKLCIIMTGSQGEPLAALSRIAYAEHRSVEIKKGDRIILSSNTIPGNEKPIFKMIDELYKRGADVIYSELADVHVSGHAYREEIKIMHELVRPKYFVPIHGEYRMLHQHAQLCHELGMPYEKIFLLNNGDICAFSEDFAGVVGYTNANAVLIDGSRRQAADTRVLSERKSLAEDGIVLISLSLDTKQNRISQLRASSKGFLFESNSDDFSRSLKKIVDTYAKKHNATNEKLSVSGIQQGLRQDLLNFFYNQYGRRPLLELHILEN